MNSQGYDSDKPAWRSKKFLLIWWIFTVLAVLYVLGEPMDTEVAIMALAMAGGGAAAQAWIDRANAERG